MGRFDPLPDVPYATCSDCGDSFPSRDEMSAHLAATMPEGGRSHSARVTNATRIERIERELHRLAESAAIDFVDEALRLTYRQGVTEDEVSQAIRYVEIDVASIWKERDE